MGRTKSLPSKEKQLEELKRKGILTRDGRNPSSGRKVQTSWTVYRLYKFYVIDKNPKTKPYFQAYGQDRNALSRIEKEGEKARIATPRGSLSGRQYVRRVDDTTEQDVTHALPRHVTPRYGRYYRSVQHVRDEFTYRFQPPVTATQANTSKASQRCQDASEEITGILRTFIRARGRLYRNHAVGAIIHYRTRNVETATGVTNPDGYIRVPWITLSNTELFNRALMEGFETAIEIVYNYPGGSISIRKVDVYISTKFRGTNIDMLRARS